MQTIKQTIITIIICMAVVAGVSLVSAWTGPLQAPPGCTSGDPGCDAPINVSAAAQTLVGSKILNVKSDGTGSLGINGALTVNGLGVFNSNVGIGTAAPNPSKGLNGYLDAKDVYLRDTGKWASESGGGSLNCQVVNSAEVCVQQSLLVNCPANFTVTGGGWHMTQWFGGRNSPDASYPNGLSGWRVNLPGSNNCFVAYAVCCKIN